MSLLNQQYQVDIRTSSHIGLVIVGRGLVNICRDRYIRLQRGWIRPSLFWYSKYIHKL